MTYFISGNFSSPTNIPNHVFRTPIKYSILFPFNTYTHSFSLQLIFLSPTNLTNQQLQKTRIG